MNKYRVAYPLYVHVEAETPHAARWAALRELVDVFTARRGILELMDRGIVDIDEMPTDLVVEVIEENNIEYTITEITKENN